MNKKTILSDLQTIFNGHPWYGYPIIKIVESIPEAHINNRYKQGNSIAQILQHMIAWRTFAIEKLKGNADFKIEINSTQDWRKDKQYTIEEWHQLIETLKVNQATLIELIEPKSDEFLANPIPKGNYSYVTMLQNSIQHDLYHLGQVALLNK